MDDFVFHGWLATKSIFLIVAHIVVSRSCRYDHCSRNSTLEWEIIGYSGANSGFRTLMLNPIARYLKHWTKSFHV